MTYINRRCDFFHIFVSIDILHNMKHLSTLIVAALFSLASVQAMGAAPDSVFVRPLRNGNALRLAYSVDNRCWNPVDVNLLSCDYGAWGSEKKMASEPSVIRDADGEWYAVWAVNGRVNQFATAHTHRLEVWVPQDYPYMTTETENVVDPVLSKRGSTFVVTYGTAAGNTYETTSTDFVHWTAAKKTGAAPLPPAVIRAPWAEIESLIVHAEASAFRASRDNSGMGDDRRVFEPVKDLRATLTADLNDSKPISPDLFGIFFEDINYAADGGLYGEMLQNRDFEYSEKDHRGWNAQMAWTAQLASPSGGRMAWDIADEAPIHENNRHYSRLRTEVAGGVWLANTGYDGAGFRLRKGEKFDFSLLLRTDEKRPQKLRVSLAKGDTLYASSVLNVPKGRWKQLSTVLTANADADDACLCIEPLTAGCVDVDFASLFPQNTFRNRKNGMRADLAQALADMKPRFVRFPGGCVSHGNGIDNIYHWGATIGPLWERQPDWNIWHYHQSRGLGFFEYFQFCEDIGAEPLPVLAAGVPCQNSSVGGNGQQGGIPFERELKSGGKAPKYYYKGKPLTMESYLQELLDLIEWANGDARRSKLAKMRADAGHKAPFNLKYLGIGNEDLLSETFFERYHYLCREIKKAHPEICIVGTVGPFWEGSDYEYGWEDARREGMACVDEHYYNPVGWYLHHQDFYDKYDRSGTKVYLGEWASKGNRWENALAEAIHITNIERNADVVVMSSYAPLLAREGHTQWNPDLIYFNRDEVKPTPNYYIQMLNGRNAGTQYIYSDLRLSDQAASQRVKASVVRAENGDVIVKLVNALPVATALTLCLDGLPSDLTEATLTQLSADVNARSVAAPSVSTLSVSGSGFELSLPEYSFTVIRLQTKR